MIIFLNMIKNLKISTRKIGFRKSWKIMCAVAKCKNKKFSLFSTFAVAFSLMEARIKWTLKETGPKMKMCVIFVFLRRLSFCIFQHRCKFLNPYNTIYVPGLLFRDLFIFSTVFHFSTLFFWKLERKLFVCTRGFMGCAVFCDVEKWPDFGATTSSDTELRLIFKRLTRSLQWQASVQRSSQL